MLVMTFNLRFQNDFDGKNSWDNRKQIVTELISHYAPSVLGTQEGTVGQLRYLQENLADYELFAPERLWEEDCQYCSLFYRRDRLMPLGGGEFWLSDTPEVHRSIGWDSAYPRMISYGFFQEVNSDRKICAAVTHLDNIGIEARKQQARIACEWLSDQECPRILMGDFNDRPSSEVHKVITGSGLLDTWQVLRKLEDESGITYHKFQGIPQVFRMDWIFVTSEFDVTDARVIRDHGPEDRYPSDHFPYLARLVLNH